MFEQGERPDGASGPSLSTIWRESVGVAAVMTLAGEPLAGRTPAQLLELLSGWERQAAWIAAQQTQLITLFAQQTRAEYAASRQQAEERGLAVVFSDQDVENDIEAEVGVALRLSSRTAGSRVATAQQLCGRLSATQQALAAGQISYWHAAAIEQETRHLTDPAAQAVEAKVLPRAGNNTVAGLRRRLRRAAAQVTPNSDAARAREAKAAREVAFTPEPDGMASLTAFGPAPDLQAVFDVLDIIAGRAPTSDNRPMAARRFDALVAAVLGRADTACCPQPAKVPARVHVTMDLPTLLGLRNNPAELHGYGPLPAPLARVLAADNGWYRLIHDPITGAPQDLGRTRRHPSVGLADWIRVRDRVCCFPQCYRAAARCDLDHRIPDSHGGGCDKANLAPLCPKHHRVKDTGWTYQLHPDQIVWTSPHGFVYTRHLPDPDLTMPPDLEAIADLDTEGHTRLDLADFEPPRFEPPEPGFSGFEPSDIEPQQFDSPEPDFSEFEPGTVEPDQFEAPDFEPSRCESPEFDVPEFDVPEFDLPECEPPPHE
jgi:hypothetical protein